MNVKRFAGYQTEVTFERHDSSFSAFGNKDPSGSVWLAFQIDDDKLIYSNNERT